MSNEELTDFEKMIEGTTQFAAMIYTYYQALKDNGFPEPIALALTIEYQKEAVGVIFGGNVPPNKIQ